MKAVRLLEYGEPLAFNDVPPPTITRDLRKSHRGRAIGSRGGGAVNSGYALLCCRDGSHAGTINGNVLEDR